MIIRQETEASLVHKAILTKKLETKLEKGKTQSDRHQRLINTRDTSFLFLTRATNQANNCISSTKGLHIFSKPISVATAQAVSVSVVPFHPQEKTHLHKDKKENSKSLYKNLKPKSRGRLSSPIKHSSMIGTWKQIVELIDSFSCFCWCDKSSSPCMWHMKG